MTSYPLRFRARASRPSPHPTSRTRAGGRGSMDLTHASVDIQEDGGFVADRPGIVSGRNHKGVAGLQLTFRAIAADDFQPPLDHVSDVPNLAAIGLRDRKSTRLNSSHVAISYAVFCLKKKNKRHLPI